MTLRRKSNAVHVSISSSTTDRPPTTAKNNNDISPYSHGPSYTSGFAGFKVNDHSSSNIAETEEEKEKRKRGRRSVKHR